MRNAGTTSIWTAASLATLTAIGLFGCEQSSPSDGSRTTSISPATSAYRSIHGSGDVAVVDATAQARLDAAIAEARRHMDKARVRWTSADEAGRRDWLVKWAAPTAAAESTTQSVEEDDVEHVWVLPLQWSAFRIEGILMSRPVRELSCGKGEGELVGFPAEELSDWVYQPSAGSNAVREGGYTLDAIQSKQ